MNNLLLRIHPNNNIQRIWLFFSIALTIAIVIIHNPFDGYYAVAHTTTYYNEECQNEVGDRYWNHLITLDEAEKAFDNCTPPDKTEFIPFSEWSSIAPVYPWFGSLLHTIILIFALWIIYILGSLMLFPQTQIRITNTHIDEESR